VFRLRRSTPNASDDRPTVPIVVIIIVLLIVVVIVGMDVAVVFVVIVVLVVIIAVTVAAAPSTRVRGVARSIGKFARVEPDSRAVRRGHARTAPSCLRRQQQQQQQR
jgi:ABC-type multidrug transport system fused ATPase/permease subunit